MDLELYARYWTLYIIGYLPLNIALCLLINYGFMSMKSFVFNRKIIQKYNNKEYLRDMFYAIAVTPIFAIIPSFFDYLHTNGYSNFYQNFDDHSIPYFIASIFVLIILQDCWHYFIHRFAHNNDWYYNHFHSHHHATNNTQAGTTLKLHPVDILFSSIYLFGVLLLPIHIYALAISSTFLVFLIFYYHSGFEILPKFFSKIPPQYLFVTAVGHNYHHSHQRCHYGLYFGYMDYIFKTERPEFREKFKEMTNKPYFAKPEDVRWKDCPKLANLLIWYNI